MIDPEYHKILDMNAGNYSQEQENERKNEIMNEIKMIKNKFDELEYLRESEYNNHFELSDSEEERDFSELKNLIRNYNKKENW